MGREGDWVWGREHNGVESCIIKLYTRNLHNGINQCYPNKSQFLKDLTFKHTHINNNKIVIAVLFIIAPTENNPNVLPVE